MDDCSRVGGIVYENERFSWKEMSRRLRKIRSLSKNWRFSASLSTPDSTVAAWNSGFWNSGILEDYTDYTDYTDLDYIQNNILSI